MGAIGLLGTGAAVGADPLNGANFYVPGPRKGAAAGAIAQLVRRRCRPHPK